MKFAASIPALAALLHVAAGNPPPAGSYAVSSGSYDLGGFKCGKQETTCKIWYPTQLSKGPYPIVTFGHGLGGDLLDDLISSVASLGMVVVAPATSGGSCDESDDMLHAIAGSKATPSLHAALGHVDWSRAGIMGHSMGGAGTIHATPKALSQPEQYHVKAALISHPYKDDDSTTAAQITVPAMFVTGTEDHRGNVKKDYDACPGRPKVFAQVAGAAHMEPLSPGRLNQFDAHFMGCHVAGLAASCEKVYGGAAGDMCQAVNMTACELAGAPPVPGPPAPAPTPAPPTPPAPAPSSACTFSAYGEGVTGTQIGATLAADTKEACCALCRANAACKSAGWRNATAAGEPMSPVCHLKDCAPATCGAKVAGVMTCTPSA